MRVPQQRVEAHFRVRPYRKGLVAVSPNLRALLCKSALTRGMEAAFALLC